MFWFVAFSTITVAASAALVLACSPVEPEPTLTATRVGEAVLERSSSKLGPSPLVSVTATAAAERHAHCVANVLPTSTPQAGATATPVPTPPSSIAAEDVPENWVSKMVEIEEWVRGYYGVDDELVGDFTKRFVADADWERWQTDRVASWSELEGSTEDLWEQNFKALTLLPPDDDYAEFEANFLADQIVGSYNYNNRELSIRVRDGEFDLFAELVYVHEFAHHVQESMYGYSDAYECFAADSDARRALTALIEGDALRTQLAYVEEVIGWQRFNEISSETDAGGEHTPEETAMRRFRDEQFRFTYSEGPFFVFQVALSTECVSCDTERERIDDAFRIPPVTTEQILHTDKYFDGEGRTKLRLPRDLLGEGWEHRSASTMGKSNWIALLVALTQGEAQDLEPETPGWMGDFTIMFERDDGQALHLQTVRWENKSYADKLIAALDARPQLERVFSSQSLEIDDFYSFVAWRSVFGFLALGSKRILWTGIEYCSSQSDRI